MRNFFGFLFLLQSLLKQDQSKCPLLIIDYYFQLMMMGCSILLFIMLISIIPIQYFRLLILFLYLMQVEVHQRPSLQKSFQFKVFQRIHFQIYSVYHNQITIYQLNRDFLLKKKTFYHSFEPKNQVKRQPQLLRIEELLLNFKIHLQNLGHHYE